MTFPNSGTLDYIPDGAVFWAKVGQRDLPVVFPDATTMKKGVVEKATTSEAESGASDKFPDAAGVVAAISTNKSGDSDKLDGQHGSYYRNASNLNSGTVPTARLPEATTTSKGVSRQASQQEALDVSNVDAYMTPDLVHDAFNQYGLGGDGTFNIENVNDIDVGSLGYIFTAADNKAFSGGGGYITTQSPSDNGRLKLQIGSDCVAGNRIGFRTFDLEGLPDSWHEIFHTGFNKNIGVNQSWQDVTSSRSTGVSYTNTTGKPIFVFIQQEADGSVTATVDGVDLYIDGATGVSLGFSFIVPDSSSYIVEGSSVSGWKELR